MHFFSFVYLFSYHYFAVNFLSYFKLFYFVIQDSAALLLMGTFMFHKTNLKCFKEGTLLLNWSCILSKYL